MSRSWARRNLAAATSFMARVIFWVDSTERIRRRISLSVGMNRSSSLPAHRKPRSSPRAFLPPSRGLDPSAHRELGLGLVHRLRQSLAQIVGQLLLVGDVAQELRRFPVHERVQELLERLDLVHREIVEHALSPREDDADLALHRLGNVLPLLQDLDHALTPR